MGMVTGRAFGVVDGDGSSTGMFSNALDERGASSQGASSSTARRLQCGEGGNDGEKTWGQVNHKRASEGLHAAVAAGIRCGPSRV